MKFTVPHNTVKALLLAAGKNDTRYYLNSILLDVRPSDSVLVATDGHVLLALPVAPDGTADDVPYTPGQYIIPRDLLETVKPAYKGADVTIEIIHHPVTFDAIRPDTPVKHPPTVAIHAGGTKLTGALVDAQYPFWRRVVPLEVSGIASQFDAEYVGTFGKINKLLGAKYSPAIAHNGAADGDGGAARVHLVCGIGVIMPMRYGNATALDNPSWLETSPSAPVSAAA